MKQLVMYLFSSVVVASTLNVNFVHAATVNNATFTTVGGSIQDNSFDNGPSDFLFNVSGLAPITNEVNLTLENLTHPDLFELELFLIAPTGQVLTLAQTLIGEEMTQTVLSDAGQLNIDLATPPYTGIFAPSGESGFAQPSNISSFSGFNGFNPNGTWRLRIYDTLSGNVGTLSSASLEISAVPEPLTLLGAAVATGFGAFFKKKLANKS
ncbi:Proprotein convertase P [Gloeothece citriformis PCC 7424]|uniref:Proprotein convertase P n=1 Tax=Gloeothece citriformis (strain PCC 7424) TaxID=65393 RepID=B7KEX3_GLOC7|nr:PEP-CTERM sorting domain-containing protein [Gloeothece citriformis]ACK70429.1 Proprotein convertase P [Gloeothece citriformis PCC 7424]